MRRALVGTLLLALAACTSTPKTEAPTPASATSQPPAVWAPSTRPGGYYKDDGPGENPPANLDGVADAMPKLEPLNRFANRPYAVFGRNYIPAEIAARTGLDPTDYAGRRSPATTNSRSRSE